jgi:outer membrane receptor for ferrienterochelin and colicin
LFGFFSVFNGDALKSVDFYKGSFPARYGGRLSSVIDIKMKEGNQQKLAGEAGIGLLSSRFTLEGPIQKGKSSFLISARRSYFDIPFAIAAKANPSDKSNFYFYDLNAKVNFDLGTKDKLMLSSYFGADNLSSQTQAVRTAYTVNTTDRLSWGNATATARWNHLFSEKLFANTTLLFTNFEFNFSNQFKQTFVNNAPTIDLLSKFSSGIQDFSLKFDMDYFPNNQHNLKWGGILTHHKFSPRTVTSTDPKTQVAEVLGQDFRNQELAVYVEDHYEIKKGLSVNAGLRASAFLTNGKNYLRAEPRISLGYQLPKDWMLKASYTRNNQFIHLLSNTGIGLSTDLWVPTTAVLAPQQSDQWAIGLSKNFDKQGLSFSVESYRKYMRNIVAYKEGADFLSFAEGVVNTNWENKVTTGKGWAYGTEFLLQKEQGRLRGWVGYTLSWVVHQFDDLNQGKRFFPKNDRRHDATIALSYQLSPKIKLTANWSYATGNALTVTEGFVPQGTSYGNGDGGGVLQPYQRSNFYSNRGNFRAEAFHRLDVGIQFHKPKPWGERYWEIGIYNLYNRSNPFYYYPSGNYNSNEIQIKKRGMFPIVPSVSYHIKF